MPRFDKLEFEREPERSQSVEQTDDSTQGAKQGKVNQEGAVPGRLNRTNQTGSNQRRSVSEQGTVSRQRSTPSQKVNTEQQPVSESKSSSEQNVKTKDFLEVKREVQSRYRTPSDWIEAAIKERRLGRFEMALRYYSRALEQDRTLVSCWVGQVQSLLFLHEERQAELWSINGLKIFPENGDLLAGRAMALSLLGSRNQAMDYADAAMQATGVSAWRWLVRGEILLAKKSSSAEHCLQMAVNVDPDWLVKLELSRICLWHNRTWMAMKYLDKVLEEVPDSPYAWLIKGRCLRKQGNYKAARSAFLRAKKIFPEYDEALDEYNRTSSGLGLVRRFFNFIFRR